MLNEQKIVDTLCEKLSFLKDRVSVQRSKRIFTDPLSREEFAKAINYLHDEMGFYKASHVVGRDDGENLGFIYILSNKDGIILALKQKAPKSDPRISSQTCIYPSVLLHERELVDLFGAIVEGLPKGLSYPLPDGWPKGNYPLRKDWNPKYFDRKTMTYNPPEDEADKENRK